MERKQIRLQEYDYSQTGGYFVTICTREHRAILGNILPGSILDGPTVVLTEIGKIVGENIEKIPTVYPDIAVEKYVIMPNHVHMLLTLRRARIVCVPADQSRSKMEISKVIQSFKASVTRQVRHAYNACPTKAKQISIWQARFYDHVIRNDADYARIWQYIDTNPARWAEDVYYTN